MRAAGLALVLLGLGLALLSLALHGCDARYRVTMTPAPLDAVADYGHVSGFFERPPVEVAEVNDDLPDSPELVNEDPYGDGWMVKITIGDESDLEDLMTAEEYQEYIEESEEE